MQVCIVICGEIHIKKISSNPNVKDLEQALKQYNMRFLIDFPTRIRRNTQSAIDNVLTNFSQS